MPNQRKSFPLTNFVSIRNNFTVTLSTYILVVPSTEGYLIVFSLNQLKDFLFMNFVLIGSKLIGILG